MNTRRVAIVGLNSQLDQALSTMMRNFSELSNARWQRAPITEADVLIAGPAADWTTLSEWIAAGKPSITIDAGLTQAVATFELRHPFRSAELLAVLDDADRLLRQQASSGRLRAAASNHPWAFAESLRTLPRRDARGLWYRTEGSAGDTIHVRDDLMFLRASAATIARLRTQDLGLSPLQAATQPPADTVPLPGFALGWFCAMHGAPGLAPWLDLKSMWRLRQWPDFGLVGSNRATLELAALLGRHQLDTSQLITCSGQSAASVHRFLNACAMAGLLTNGSGANAAQGRGSLRESLGATIGELFQSLQHSWVASG